MTEEYDQSGAGDETRNSLNVRQEGVDEVEGSDEEDNAGWVFQ